MAKLTPKQTVLIAKLERDDTLTDAERNAVFALPSSERGFISMRSMARRLAAEASSDQAGARLPNRPDPREG